ncbi:integrase/recombinase XerD [Novimethylophilus kurashikiensis]|uniref:Integrase/recombinase XerD n=1 Tax=Novimethylophilus kurashikiensis TaxID=1825523 RepID=A0A2R5FEH9_9PROT|nr:site-specific integrase [Novimethylophilus kurashikiensis]GBG14854.1 integrase/recombinase XerD [Novimethylophilus kurashikiensis]
MAKSPEIDVKSGLLFAGSSLLDWSLHPRESFARWLAGEVVAQRRQFRASSADTYTHQFETWLRFLEARHSSLLEATQDDAEAYFNQLSLKHVSRRRTHKEGIEAVSRRRYLQLIDRVYRALRQLGWDGANPMLLELKKERGLAVPEPASLTDEEVDRLWRAIKLLDGWKGDRDRAMAALLLGAGLRCNELLAMPWSAVGPDYRVRILPAGVHREHVSIILPGQARGFWELWERDRHDMGVRSEVAFPATRAGRPYTESGVFRRIDTWLRMANIHRKEDRGVNLLRNTFARQALLRYSPEEVQEFLGHEELRSTVRHGLTEPD